ncbi:MAG: hypothetical protein WBL39_23400, partial [Terrimicrobiaceae bacterium]
HQLVHGPDLRVNVDRTRAEQLGLSQRDVAGTVLTSLSSSGRANNTMRDIISFCLRPRREIRVRH